MSTSVLWVRTPHAAALETIYAKPLSTISRSIYNQGGPRISPHRQHRNLLSSLCRLLIRLPRQQQLAFPFHNNGIHYHLHYRLLQHLSCLPLLSKRVCRLLDNCPVTPRTRLYHPLLRARPRQQSSERISYQIQKVGFRQDFWKYLNRHHDQAEISRHHTLAFTFWRGWRGPPSLEIEHTLTWGNRLAKYGARRCPPVPGNQETLPQTPYLHMSSYSTSHGSSNLFRTNHVFLNVA